MKNWIGSFVRSCVDIALDIPEGNKKTETSSDATPLFEPMDENVIGNAFNYHEAMLTGNAQQRAEATAAYHDLLEEDR